MHEVLHDLNQNLNQNSIEVNEASNQNSNSVVETTEPYNNIYFNSQRSNLSTNRTPKHLAPCPFLRRRGRRHCLKGFSVISRITSVLINNPIAPIFFPT